MKIQDPTLRVVPNTPALTQREIRVFGLTDRTCKLTVILRLVFSMFWFSITYGCSERCCFHKEIGYEIGEVLDVTVTNCTEVRYY